MEDLDILARSELRLDREPTYHGIRNLGYAGAIAGFISLLAIPSAENDWTLLAASLAASIQIPTSLGIGILGEAYLVHGQPAYDHFAIRPSPRMFSALAWSAAVSFFLNVFFLAWHQSWLCACLTVLVTAITTILVRKHIRHVRLHTVAKISRDRRRY